MKKKRGHTTPSTSRKLIHRGIKLSSQKRETGRGLSQGEYSHSSPILRILFTLTFVVFITAILVLVSIDSVYLNLWLGASLLVILLQLWSYLRQEHHLGHLKIFPKRYSKNSPLRQIGVHHQRRYRFTVPKLHLPKLHFPRLNLAEGVKRIKTSFGSWRFKIHFPNLKRKHHAFQKMKKSTSSRQLLKRFFSLGRKASKSDLSQSDQVKKEEKMKIIEEHHIIPKNLHLGTYETEIDAVYKTVKDKGKISIDEIDEKWKVKLVLVQEWAKILEEHKLIQIYYPTLGSPELRIYPEKKLSEKEEVSS